MHIQIQLAQQNDLEAILQLQKDCYISEAMIYNDYDNTSAEIDLIH